MTRDLTCKRKRFTEKDAWRDYPYKTKSNKESLLKTTSGENYVRKDEVVRSHPFSITYEMYRQIIDVFIENAMEYIKSGGTVYIPSLGRFCYKRKRRPIDGPSTKLIDWHATNKKYGEHNKTAKTEDKKFVYHENLHTNGYTAASSHDYHNHKIKNRKLYKFSFSRKNNRHLAKLIQDEPSLIYNFETIRPNE